MFNGVPRDVYFDHNYKEGDIAYLLCNPGIVPKGYVKLEMYFDHGELCAREICEDAGRQTYQVNKWCGNFLTLDELNAKLR